MTAAGTALIVAGIALTIAALVAAFSPRGKRWLVDLVEHLSASTRNVHEDYLPKDSQDKPSRPDQERNP